MTDQLIEHLSEHAVDAAVVVEGTADAQVEQLLASGWTLGETMIQGRLRVRVLRSPGS